MKRERRAVQFTEAALATGYLHLHARVSGLPPGAPADAALLSSEEIHDTEALLAEQGIRGDGAREVLLSAAAARAAAAGGSATALTKAAHEAARDELLEEWGVERALRAQVWPATGQTLMSRLGGGYWSAAVARLGFLANEGGRARGLVRFTDDDYAAAVRDFLAAEPAETGNHSYSGYTAWQALETDGGRRRPSAAAVRKYFGSWSAAKATAG